MREGLYRGVLKKVCALCLLILSCSSLGNGYSVLTHEQLVDLLWQDKIRPLLLKRFPNATEDDLKKAHAYAYGGSVMHDMGYYPFGSKYFSDLVHYMRTGDFVEALLRDSSDLNEYAFALGALSHYAADNCGHPTINRVVAIEFPHLKKKYGNEVTYADDRKAHIQTEFGFDMVQVAKNRYTSDHYHDFIGFEISKPLMERAFFETYNLKLQDVFGDEDLAIGTFRRAISQVIPEMTRVALLTRKKEIVQDTPNFSRKKFLYYLSRAQYQKEWGSIYRKPGIGTRILAFFLKIIPKVGPFRAVNFKIPTTQTEDLYIKSMNLTVETYTRDLTELRKEPLDLPNRDFDTGRAASAGEYPLADSTYARYVDDISDKNADVIPPEVLTDIFHFYTDMEKPIATKRHKKAWEKLQAQLAKLKAQTALGPAASLDHPATEP